MRVDKQVLRNYSIFGFGIRFQRKNFSFDCWDNAYSREHGWFKVMIVIGWWDIDLTFRRG